LFGRAAASFFFWSAEQHSCAAAADRSRREHRSRSKSMEAQPIIQPAASIEVSEHMSSDDKSIVEASSVEANKRIDDVGIEASKYPTPPGNMMLDFSSC
jgi:hypothetical protein